MPYLRLTCPTVTPARRRELARQLTEAVVDLFTPPRGATAEEIRARTTVHFAVYGKDELFVGGQTVAVGPPDVTLELSDWSMSVRQQRRAAARLTPLLVAQFDTREDAVNLRFHAYPPTDFAVGGRLLSDRLPIPARVAKRIFG